MAPYLGLGLVASVLLAFGLLMMKSRADVLPAVGRGSIISGIAAWLRDPVWLGGLGVQTAGYALYMIALSGAPVSLLAVMMQGGIAIFVMLAVIFLGERARLSEWLGVAGIVLAMGMLAASLGQGDADSTVNPGALAVLSGGAMLASIAPTTGTRLRTNGASAAIASGIAFGLGSLYTKALTSTFLDDTCSSIVLRATTNPYLYLTIAASIAGLVMLQNAFHRGRGIIVMPLSSALSNLMPILGGVIVFGERLPAAPLAASMRVGAFTLTLVGGAMLSLSREP